MPASLILIWPPVNPNRIALTTNLFLDEYIPRSLYEKYKAFPAILTGLLDKRLILADQALRDHFGPVTINNWWMEGPRQYSGLRTTESPDFSPTSQHTFGRASDKLFSLATAEEVREWIRKNWQSLSIFCIEENVNWVHSDCRYTQNQQLLIVTP